MTIKQKIMLSFLLVALSIGLLGGGTFYHDIVSAERVATLEAANIAWLFVYAVRHELEESGEPLASAGNRREFQKYVDQYKRFQRRDIVIVDLERRIVADTLPGEVGKLYDEDHRGEVGRSLEDGAVRFFVEKNLDYPQGIKQMVIPFAGSDGVRVGALVLEYTPLYDEIIAGIKGEAKKFLSFFAAALLLALGLGYRLARSISGTLAIFKTAALAIADGRLETRAEFARADEFGLLAHSFNTMAAHLQQSHQELSHSHYLLEQESSSLKLSEEALKRSEANFRTLFENAKDGICRLSVQGEILALNESFARMHGYGREEMVGMKIKDLDVPASGQLAPERIQRTLAGEKLSFEVEHYVKSGQTIPLEVSIHMVSQGGEQSIWGLHRDITERRRAEKERAELGERLRQAQKMEAIGTLSGGIAHDFNNILAAITGYSQLALMRPEGNKLWLEDIRQVLKAAARASDLVRQILTFSRQQPQEKAPVQLAPIVEEALKLLRATLPSTIEIRRELHATATVFADATQIHQVVMNLGTNAYHAMMERGGVLTVTLAEREFLQPLNDAGTTLPPGSYLVLTVADSGCGMSSETREKIFEPYFTTKEMGKGTGMGLAVVYGIVKSHRGMIAVTSELGQGSTFTVTLPIIGQEAVRGETAAAPLPVRSQARLMVVDDEKDIRECLGLLLSQAGYQVTSCGDGAEAWEVFSPRPGEWDLLVTDQTMPGLTGGELVAKVHGLRPELPVIVCSGYYGALGAEEEARAAGVSACLRKPVEINLLLAQVAKALDAAARP